jgi:hypothetical protein
LASPLRAWNLFSSPTKSLAAAARDGRQGEVQADWRLFYPTEWIKLAVAPPCAAIPSKLAKGSGGDWVEVQPTADGLVALRPVDLQKLLEKTSLMILCVAQQAMSASVKSVAHCRVSQGVLLIHLKCLALPQFL